MGVSSGRCCCGFIPLTTAIAIIGVLNIMAAIGVFVGSLIQYHEVKLGVFACGIVINLIVIVVNVLLIVGASKRKHPFLIPSLIIQVKFELAAISISILASIVFIAQSQKVLFMAIVLGTSMPSLGILIWFLATVIKCYRFLKHENENAVVHHSA